MTIYYNVNGNPVAIGRDIEISALKAKYPSYTDDQLLDTAITLAEARGGETKIIWDGSAIHFTGETHECKGFGGIDFNGSKIYMPDYDDGIIIDIVPDSSEDITVPYTDIGEHKTTNVALKDKVFTINDVLSGNADMCLGYRYGRSTEVTLYYAPTIKTQPDGFYETGDLYMLPLSGDVVCYNVHDYPALTFVLENGVIVASSTDKQSTFARCRRSNTRVHNFVLNGQSEITEFQWGVFKFEYCVRIEADHISGLNPVPKEHGGYAISLLSVSFAYVHDVNIGDSTSWGCIGNRMLNNVVFERCYINRWDCHFAQFGNITIKNCVIGLFIYGVGRGVISVSDCTFRVENTTVVVIAMRPDCPGVFDGDIIFNNCEFQLGERSAENLVIWTDGNNNPKPANSEVTGAPHKIRELKHCKFPEQCKALFQIRAHADDASMFENITYIVKDSTFSCLDSMFITDNTAQALKKLIVDNCTLASQFYITKTLSDCHVDIKGVTAAGKNMQVKENTSVLSVSDSNIAAVVADQASNKLIMTGCVLSGAQSVSNFTAYALSGNIASDMASVNKHS